MFVLSGLCKRPLIPTTRQCQADEKHNAKNYHRFFPLQQRNHYEFLPRPVNKWPSSMDIRIVLTAPNTLKKDIMFAVLRINKWIFAFDGSKSADNA